MKKLILTISILLITLVLTACGTKVESGEVIGRQFVAAHYTTEYNMVYMGQTCVDSICSPNYTHVPYQKHNPNAWFLELKNQEGKTGKVQVSEQIFQQAKTGYEYQNGILTPK